MQERLYLSSQVQTIGFYYGFYQRGAQPKYGWRGVRAQAQRVHATVRAIDRVKEAVEKAAALNGSPQEIWVDIVSTEVMAATVATGD